MKSRAEEKNFAVETSDGQAATGSNRQQQAATGSNRQQQAATGSNRQQQAATGRKVL
jgi:hypothetical protein